MKRVSQWVIVNRSGEVTHCYDSRAECREVLLGSNDAPGCRTVRLVEYDAAKEAVVRAAVRQVAAVSKAPPDCRWPEDEALARAVERMQKGRRK